MSTDELQIDEQRSIFYMTDIEIDGVRTYRPDHLHSNYFMTIKDELDVFDNPRDTGAPFIWKSDMQVSIRHWLECKVIIPLHSRCLICGRRYMDEEADE